MARIIYSSGYPELHDVWGWSDINEVIMDANDSNTELSTSEIAEVMQIIIRSFDCNLGINNEIILIAFTTWREEQFDKLGKEQGT